MNYNDASLIITPNGVKAGKLYALKGDDLNVVRATSATRVNASGLIELVGANVSRLDYSNGSCPSILVEPQRTNVWINSEDFNSGTLNSSLITYTANSETSPSGTLTADKFEVTTSGGDAFRRFTRTIAIQNFTLSLYVKGNAGQKFQLFLARDGFAELKGIDVTLSGDWQRIILSDSFSTTSSTVVMGAEFGFDSNDSVVGQVYYLWGAQLEAGSYATSYIPTTSASVTRNADVISKTGISSLIGQTEGTMFIDINYKADSVFKNFFNLGTSTSSYIAIVARNNNKIGVEVLNAGVQVNTEGSTIYTSQRLKIAFAYKANDFAMYINGVLAFSQSSGTVPAKAEVYLGSYGNGIWQPKDGINSAALWKTRLSNTELATLTTI